MSRSCVGRIASGLAKTAQEALLCAESDKPQELPWPLAAVGEADSWEGVCLTSDWGCSSKTWLALQSKHSSG